MAGAGQRRGSMDVPPSLSESRDGLLGNAGSFVRQLEAAEPRLSELLGGMAAAVRDLEVLWGTGAALRAAGVASGGARVTFGVGLGLFVCAAPFLGALGLAAAAAVLGGVAVTVVNVHKLVKQTRLAGQVENLGAEFLEAADGLRLRLENLKDPLENPARLQAQNTLENLKELQENLGRLSELRRRSRGPSGVGTALLDQIRDLLNLMVPRLRLSVEQQDGTLGENIVQSARQSENVMSSLLLMRNQLERFRDGEPSPENLQ